MLATSCSWPMRNAGGCRAILCPVFDEHYGFTPLVDSAPTLYLPLGRLEPVKKSPLWERDCPRYFKAIM